jgi:hypothetical protein
MYWFTVEMWDGKRYVRVGAPTLDEDAATRCRDAIRAVGGTAILVSE